MKKLFKAIVYLGWLLQIVAVLSVGIFVTQGCGSHKTSTPIEQNATQPVADDKPYLILSQDPFDGDNYSLMTAAAEMHKRGLIHLVAVDVTGRDTCNKSGLAFNTLLAAEGLGDIPVFVNHSQRPQRVTPSTCNFSLNDEMQNDELLDSQRPDSSIGLAEIIHSLPQGAKIVYVVGGHLTNLADLMAYDMEAANRIDVVSISTGWQSRYNQKPEMNLSQGVNKPTGTSDATIKVMTQLKSKIVIVSDPDAPYPHFELSILDKDKPLYYFITHGHYANGHDVGVGDFEALLYGAVGLDWYGRSIGKEIKTCFKPNSYGAVKISGGNCNHYYVDDFSSSLEKDILINLLKGH